MSPPILLRNHRLLLATVLLVSVSHAKVADRSRIVKARLDAGHIDRYHDNGRPIEGQGYRSRRGDDTYDVDPNYNNNNARQQTRTTNKNRMMTDEKNNKKVAQPKQAPWKMEFPPENEKADLLESKGDVALSGEAPEQFRRKLSSQLSGCCYDYQGYSAQDLCNMYGNDCESGETPSHDSTDGDCSQDGLSFIGISFSVNTASGNPYSYQLCDQFPMENIIDRDYEFIMSMDEDGWLVGGGYKTFDYSGKMPYIDSSHTELLRVGNMNPETG